jgi:hypothetical protein
MDIKKLEQLSHNETFVDFLEEIHGTRESLIQQLHDVSADRIQQISGRILQCDEILVAGGFNQIQLRNMGR